VRSSVSACRSTSAGLIAAARATISRGVRFGSGTGIEACAAVVCGMLALSSCLA
jgi:hypothetical protein